MQSAILSSAMDYSCYVRILNPTNQPLTLTGRSAADGYWAVPPPQQIPPGGRGDGWLQDNPGLAGTEGAFSYDQAGKTLSFAVSCPTTTFNSASGPNSNFVARSGAHDWRSRGSVPWVGHPLQVIFTVGS